jgi:microcystin-dependent protein
MSTPYIGEIKLFAGTFAPASWADCAGQLLAISQYDALYALIGTTYGGDGVTTFGLPDLRGRIPIGQGQGPGLTNRVLGQMLGTETVTVTTNEMPGHTHNALAFVTPATTENPSGAALAQTGLANPSEPQVGNSLFYLNVNGISPNTAALPADTFQASGGSQPHDNMAPFLTVRYIISLYGIFPSRN